MEEAEEAMEVVKRNRRCPVTEEEAAKVVDTEEEVECLVMPLLL
jgi:hypothetical protein